jgi:hypothetical protein
MYIPQNQIIANLYTNGQPSDNKEDVGVLVYKNTQEIYKGFYYKTSNGKFYTGKTPNDPPNIELVLYKPLSQDIPTPYQVSLLDNPHFPVIGGSINHSNPKIVREYNQLNNNKNLYDKKHLPFQSYPKPTEDDYTLGVFT